MITEVGATLRALLLDRTELLDGFPASDMCEGSRGQVLMPWPNRLEGGTYLFDGIRGHAGLDEPERSNAIHGLVRWLPWELKERSQDRISLRCHLHPQPAYPFQLELTVTYKVHSSGLVVSTTATNLDAKDLPFGAGFHPYLAPPPSLGYAHPQHVEPEPSMQQTPCKEHLCPAQMRASGKEGRSGYQGASAPIDTCLLQLPAEIALESDERGLPKGRRSVAGTGLDFRSPRLVKETKLDTAFTSLTRDNQGRAWAVLESPEPALRTRDETGEDNGPPRAVAVWVDESFPYLMCYTGDTLPNPHRRRTGIAIEPMTCPPNAFRTGEDLIRLGPGESWSGNWGIEQRRP